MTETHSSLREDWVGAGRHPVWQSYTFQRWVLVLVFAAALLSGLAQQGFWDHHGEARRAAVGREVYADGHWLVPTLNGEPFITKPPLLYWAIAGTFRITGGASEFRARLPGVVATVGTLLLVMAMGSTLDRERKADEDNRSKIDRGRMAGLAAGLVFAANPLVLAMGRNADTEPLLLLFSTLAVYAFLRIRPGAPARTSTRWRLLLALSLALGFMVKGPLGWLFPGFGILAIEGLSPGGSRRLRWTDAAYFAVATAILVAPWFVAVAVRVPGALETWLGESVARLDPGYRVHPEPLWYYFPNLLAFGPWVALLPVALAAGPAAWRRERRDLAPLLWLLGGLLFLSLATSKRAHYLLSLAPAFALCLGPVLAGGLGLGRFARCAEKGLRSLLWGLPAALLGASLFLGVRGTAPWGPASASAVGAVGLGYYLWHSRHSWLAWPVAVALTGTAILAGLCAIPAIDDYRSPREFLLRARRVVGPTAQVWNWRTDRFSVGFYLNRTVPKAKGETQLWQVAQNGAWLFTESRDKVSLPPGSEIALVEVVRDPFIAGRKKLWVVARWTPTTNPARDHPQGREHAGAASPPDS